MPAGLEAGGPWRRIAGKGIDQVLLVAVVSGSAYLVNNMNVSSRATMAAFWFACFWLMILYNLVLVGLFATTAGKAIMGLKVVGPEGERAGWRIATRRWFLQLVYLVPVVGWLAGQGGAVVSLIYLFKDPRRQTVYDRVAGSFVVTTVSMRRAQISDQLEGDSGGSRPNHEGR
ncbi:MAG: RDD family protein [Actinomycetia bacterium]|nr:RDD family protein [Actinomycetes bacterium]